MSNAAQDHQELREAVCALCADFPPEYHRKVDEQGGFLRRSSTR
jgi:acyl-CoA dehydrogenase